MQFLVDRGLCKMVRGEIHILQKHTHTDEPIYAAKHHQNWRLKALEVLQNRNPKNKKDPNAFFFTMPMTLSKADALKIQEMLAQLVKQVIKIRDPSPSEKMVCLNIDYFSNE